MSKKMEIDRRSLMKTSTAAALGASVTVPGTVSADPDESDTPNAPTVKGDLKRFLTTAYGAEMTGPFVFRDGSFLFSLQHPSEENPEPYNKAAVGYISGFNFRMEGTNDDFEQSAKPTTDAAQRRVETSEGEFEILVQQEDIINGGTEQWGVPQTPDGIDVDKYAGSRYSELGNDPDCNQFVATDRDGTEGYLFTNLEQSPGEIARVPLSQDEDGEWNADLDGAMNLSGLDSFRALGGTRINCYGDLTPWNTMVSAEENYAHPRANLTSKPSDVVEAGTGKGLRAAHEFWNRPNPAGIQSAVDRYYGDESWYVQGYWAATGVELLAYYLGADPVDQEGFDADTEESLEAGGEVAGTNTLTPIGEGYPNPYRYGYLLDIRDPAADEPEPVKYWVMGRASWEAPDFQTDRKTVYGCSDGDSKGIYKFVADEEIDGYDDPDNISGTLYAPKVTNEAAARKNSPAEVDLEIEWLELGSATNGEVESWIAEYDDVTQVEYLESHTESWTEGDEVTPEVLEEADKEVVENGNRDFITHEEIIEWARQYERDGPDGVDEDLRRVPFLEPREAGKEIGATIEFNKAEGIDSKDGAAPGDYVYFGISEFNDDMANDGGDLQMDRVDGGIVYRGELEEDYNISTLEPVIVGPDFTDTAAAADEALRNIDNVYTMDDGRVLCCEDGFAESNRSYPNDGMYVFSPEMRDAVSAIAGPDGEVSGRDVLDAITAYNAGEPVGDTGVTLDADDVLDIITAYNQDA
jgi:secreted PhoX family phosphatase